MKKLNLLFVLMMVSVISFGQVTFTGVNWVNWGNEPDYPDVTGYAENPYDAKRKTYTVYKAPAAWAPIASVADFDATWDVLGDAEYVDRAGNIPGGDIYDLGTDNTFGAAWKAVHDGSKMYVLLKYWDVNEQADANTRSFEVMAQPKDPVRHEPTFDKGVADEDMAKKNMAYGRYVELGGGKALFVSPGTVNEYAASIGLTGAWGANTPGLLALVEEDHFWDADAGIIRAVLVMSFGSGESALSYPDDPEAVEGARTGIGEGDTFAFDVKSNAKVSDANSEYWWSADKNNGYASNYYSGHVTLSSQVLGEDPTPSYVFTGVNWVNWGNEPDYEGVTGYAENPYDDKRKTYTVYKAPAAWSPVSDVASFDATWDVLGDAEYVDRAGNIPGGDLYDLGTDNTFGAAWKAVHDGSSMYVLLKYWDVNNQADDNTRSFEIMAQPKDPVRHEPTFNQGVDDEDMAKKNMAYGRYVELGGGKALFVSPGTVNEYAASIGLTGAWGANTPGLLALVEEDHFWDADAGIIRAVLVMSFGSGESALSYPNDPGDVEGARTGIGVGATFAFDVKSNAKASDANSEYWWSADKNNGYASNYYSGHVTLSATELPTNISEIVLQRESRVYVYNGVAYVRGSEPVNLEVYNVLGARVKSAQDVRELSLKELNNGIYLIRVNGEREAIKVVKY
jgi:hypothetical protein